MRLLQHQNGLLLSAARLLGLLGIVLYVTACASGQSDPAATPLPPPTATLMAFPTFPPSHTPTSTFTATITRTATAIPTETATPEPTSTPLPETAPPPTEVVPLGGSDQILFVSNRSGENRLYVINADGTQESAVLAGEEAQIDPAWSPNRRQIAFAAGREDFDIYILNVDTGAVTQVTEGPAIDTEPVWSPNGAQLAYVSVNRQEAGLIAELHLINTDGSNDRLLASELGLLVNRASWSPDGRRLAFSTFINDQSEIHLINADGTNEINLTPEGASYNPAWSPDGRTIAFLSDRTGNTEIYTINPDGSDLQQLTDGSLNSILVAAWSPNGRRLVFNAGFSNASNLYIINADGSELFQLTDWPGAEHGPDW